MSLTVPTDATSASTLNGSNWLSDLLQQATSAYVAVQTVKAQNRTAGAVTTQDIPRVESPAPVTPIQPWVWIVGAAVVVLGVLLMFRRR